MFAGGQDNSVPVPKCLQDISALVPNCPDTSAPGGWCQNVLGPKCLDTYKNYTYQNITSFTHRHTNN